MDEEKLLQKIDEKFDRLTEVVLSQGEKLGELTEVVLSQGEKLGEIDGRLDGIDGRFNKIDGRLDGIDGRFNKIDGRLDGIDGRFNKIDGRLDSMDGQLNRVIMTLVVHEEKLESLPTREEFDRSHREIFDILDGHSVILQRLDQERVFTTEWIRRIEDDVKRIKIQLKLA